MIALYSGTPGSGKSLHLARWVADSLAVRKVDVIANFPINIDYISKKGKRKIARFTYLTNDKITVPYLKEYAQEHHVVGKESQTLLVIDEAGIMFNSRDYAQFDRKAWIQFFMTHRHYGYDVILVSQIDRMIDRQIRGFIEYDIKHRKANNFRLGLLLTLLHIPMFVAITYWYGVRERCGSELFFYRRRDSKLYDTMMLFGGDGHGGRIGKPGVSDMPLPEKGREPAQSAGGAPSPAGAALQTGAFQPESEPDEAGQLIWASVKSMVSTRWGVSIEPAPEEGKDECDHASVPIRTSRCADCHYDPCTISTCGICYMDGNQDE